MQRSFEIFDQEFIVDFDAKVTFAGCPATGPSYASGGEPACDLEWELDGDITIKRLIWTNERECVWAIKNHATPIVPAYAESEPLEIPAWLHDVIVKYLEADDDGQIYAELASADNGPDPDDARDRMRDDD